MGHIKIYRIKCPFYRKCDPGEVEWSICSIKPRNCDKFWPYEEARIVSLGQSKSIK